MFACRLDDNDASMALMVGWSFIEAEDCMKTDVKAMLYPPSVYDDYLIRSVDENCM